MRLGAWKGVAAWLFEVGAARMHKNQVARAHDGVTVAIGLKSLANAARSIRPVFERV